MSKAKSLFEQKTGVLQNLKLLKLSFSLGRISPTEFKDRKKKLDKRKKDLSDEIKILKRKK